MYTTIFGWYAVFILLRTGSVWPAIVAHTYCNWMGPPNLAVDGPRWFPATYYALLVGGAVGFYRLFWSLTESGNALAAFT